MADLTNKNINQTEYKADGSKKGNSYYEGAWRWIEDTYLSWFGENRTSYAVKDTLQNGEVTNIKEVNTLQRGVTDTVGGTFSEGGLLAPVGKLADTNVLKGNV